MTTKTNLAMSFMSSDQDQDQGSFLAGLLVGLFAGALGYFLFGTQKGGEVRNRLKTEWQVAQQDLMAEGKSGMSFESLKSWVTNFIDQLIKPNLVPASSKKIKKTNPTPKILANKFKGV